MFCNACQDIFSSPRKLSYGTYYPWQQNVASFQAALRIGCHLCNLIEESRSYDGDPNEAFPEGIRYAFKALNPKWACSGEGQKWLAPQTGSCDEDEEREADSYWNQFEMDPTPNGLASLLAMDSERLVSEAANSWLVLEFYGARDQIVLPMELATGKHSLHWGFPRLTETGDEVEELAQRNIDEQTSTGCVENLQISRTWLHNCLTNHPSCGPHQPESWLPTRLLDVGSSDSQNIRLILGSSLDAETQYVALSHRWGTNKGCELNSGNITAYQETIPLSDISATVRDSVAVTRALGFQYLWVDTMCIIQDDDSDWTWQSATMSKVYGLSMCTIAAVNSGFGSQGYFTNRNQYRIRPCRVPNPFRTVSKYSFNVRSQYLHRIHEREVKGSLWYNRGWVFQERTLSPRLLIFSGTQILWACEQLQAAETWPCGKTREHHIDRFESFKVEKARFYKLLDRSCGVLINQSTWWTFLKDYMASAELTKKSDKLVAIQGIATLIQNLTGVSYSGGFWLNDNLPESLLWKAAPVKLPRPKEYRAPSWSWAAVDGTIELNNNDSQSTRSLIRVIGHESIPHDLAQSGRSTREALKVAGMLLHATIIISQEGDRCDRVVTIEYSKTVSRPPIREQ
ncbi:hypothetical protein CJF31_00002227 [Rutstroemia sp. NJR-2017a BVV2]|nr:hypothetical protein CJF31_00010166 [Rutstroemia sp. NJR-2017a BVV2]PQE24024.1 hypothetical protein CJF31_00002227 [Rutstroemia sp. NJR-2017a BVV2]